MVLHICKLCNKIFNKKYSCSFCKDQFTRSDNLKRHLDRCKIHVYILYL